MAVSPSSNASSTAGSKPCGRQVALDIAEPHDCGGSFGFEEDVVQAHRNHVHRVVVVEHLQPRFEIQRTQMSGPLPTLREHPQSATRPIEQICTGLQATAAALLAAAVQRQCANPAQKRQSTQVRRVHDGPADAAQRLVDHYQQQTVPPGDVVRGEHQRPFGECSAGPFEAGNPQAVESASDPASRVGARKGQEARTPGVAGPGQRRPVGVPRAHAAPR